MEVTTLALAMPFVKSKVNAYLIEHRDGLLIVDVGPQSPRSYLDIREKIAALGYALTDITHIVITHGHWDHFGLAARLKEASGALVCYHALDNSRIAQDVMHQPGFGVTGERRLRQMGFGDDFMQSSRQAYQELEGGRWALYQQIAADVYLAEGDQLLTGDNALKVVHCPGHTPGSICLWGPCEGALFTGDHIIAESASEMLLEPLIHAPLGEEADIVQYVNSLEKVACLPVRAFYPGHGPSGNGFQDHVKAIQAKMEEQCQQIMACLDSRPQTALQISRMLDCSTRSEPETVSRVGHVTQCLQLLLARLVACAEAGPDNVIYYTRR